MHVVGAAFTVIDIHIHMPDVDVPPWSSLVRHAVHFHYIIPSHESRICHALLRRGDVTDLPLFEFESCPYSERSVRFFGGGSSQSSRHASAAELLKLPLAASPSSSVCAHTLAHVDPLTALAVKRRCILLRLAGCTIEPCQRRARRYDAPFASAQPQIVEG